MNKYDVNAKQVMANIDFGLLGVRNLKKPISTFDNIRTAVFTDVLVEDGNMPISQTTPVLSDSPVNYPTGRDYTIGVSDVSSDVVAPTDIRLQQEPCPTGFVRDVNGVCQPLNWSPPPPPRVVSDVIITDPRLVTCREGHIKDANGDCVPNVGVAVGVQNCPDGYVKDINGVCQPLNWSPPPPVMTSPTRPMVAGGGGGGSAVKPATQTVAPATTTPEPEKKPENKMKWVLIGVGVLLVAVVSTYFIVKP